MNFRAIEPAVHSLPLMELPPLTEQSRLDNGVELSTFHDPRHDLLRLQLIIDGGASRSPRPGLYTLAVDLATEGAGRYSGDEITDLIDFHGAVRTVSTSTSHTTLSMLMQSSALPDLLPMLRAMIVEPHYPAERIAVLMEKKARREELNAVRSPEVADRRMSAMTMGSDHPMARRLTPELCRSYTAEVIAGAAPRGRGMRICLAGNVTAEVRESVIRTFSGREFSGSCNPSGVIGAWEPEPAGIESIEVPGAQQSSIAMGLPLGVGRFNADFIPLRVATILLGGFFGSRLMGAVREREGLTYGISSALYGYANQSVGVIKCETATGNVERVVELVRRELERLSDPASYSAEELHRLRAYTESTLATRLDNAMSIMDNHILTTTLPCPETYFTDQQRYLREMTADDLSRVAGLYLRSEELRILTTR